MTGGRTHRYNHSVSLSLCAKNEVTPRQSKIMTTYLSFSLGVEQRKGCSSVWSLREKGVPSEAGIQRLVKHLRFSSEESHGDSGFVTSGESLAQRKEMVAAAIMSWHRVKT